jgi:hypothetical protein
MKHKWNSFEQPGTPDNPTEWFEFCENCGIEKDDDNADDYCLDEELCPSCGLLLDGGYCHECDYRRLFIVRGDGT